MSVSADMNDFTAPREINVEDVDYVCTMEGVLDANACASLFLKHWTNVRRKFSGIGDNAANRDTYLISLLMDMAVNAASGNRKGENFIKYQGYSIPTSMYVNDFGTNLRKFGRAMFSLFKETVMADNPGAENLRATLGRVYGVDDMSAVYSVDFSNVVETPVQFRELAEMNKGVRISRSGSSRFEGTQFRALNAKRHGKNIQNERPPVGGTSREEDVFY